MAVAVSEGVLIEPAVSDDAVAAPLADREATCTAVAVSVGVLMEPAVRDSAVAAPLAESEAA
jgi:hypothetical protein